MNIHTRPKSNHNEGIDKQLDLLANDLAFISDRLARQKNIANAPDADNMEAAFNNTVSAYCFVKDIGQLN